MGKRNRKITHAAHIKQHTVGTSNEISFSVLDAAKNALEGDNESIGGSPHHVGGISLFTLPGRRKKPVATPTKERGLPLAASSFASADKKPAAPVRASKPQRSPEEEIARRKAHRRLRKIVAVLFILVSTVTLLGLGGSYLYHDYRAQQGNIMQLEESLSLVTEADKTIMMLDTLVADPFGNDAADNRISVEAGLEDVERLLNEADTNAREASLNLRESKDKEAANQVVVAITARRSLVDKGTQIMQASQEAQNIADQTQAAWNQILQADDLARTAAQLVSDTTAEHVEASKNVSNEAIAVFNDARTSLEDIQLTYPQADLSLIVNYVDKRIEALGYAIESDDAFLQKNKEEATAQNEAYNIADAEAAVLAKNIPAQPSSVIYEAYEQVNEANLASYATARLQAGTADAFIRDYLGAEIK